LRELILTLGEGRFFFAVNIYFYQSVRYSFEYVCNQIEGEKENNNNNK